MLWRSRVAQLSRGSVSGVAGTVDTVIVLAADHLHLTVHYFNMATAYYEFYRGSSYVQYAPLRQSMDYTSGEAELEWL